ncbi:hypothetical protein J6590_018764 [Homalodisca vitripennis]|nr:hypothetical protein J6590_018764 [Homalodisca vitripennis]
MRCKRVGDGRERSTTCVHKSSAPKPLSVSALLIFLVHVKHRNAGPALAQFLLVACPLERLSAPGLDSSPTTSLCDGYLGSHTGHRATPTTSPLGLHITASTDGDTFRPGSLQREKQSVESSSFKEKVYRSKLKFSSSNPIVGI